MRHHDAKLAPYTQLHESEPNYVYGSSHLTRSGGVGRKKERVTTSESNDRLFITIGAIFFLISLIMLTVGYINAHRVSRRSRDVWWKELVEIVLDDGTSGGFEMAPPSSTLTTSRKEGKGRDDDWSNGDEKRRRREWFHQDGRGIVGSEESNGEQQKNPERNLHKSNLMQVNRKERQDDVTQSNLISAHKVVRDDRFGVENGKIVIKVRHVNTPSASLDREEHESVSWKRRNREGHLIENRDVAEKLSSRGEQHQDARDAGDTGDERRSLWERRKLRLRERRDGKSRDDEARSMRMYNNNVVSEHPSSTSPINRDKLSSSCLNTMQGMTLLVDDQGKKIKPTTNPPPPISIFLYLFPLLRS